MKPAAFEYRREGSLAATLDLLSQNPLESKLLAGGQSLVPLMNFRLTKPQRIIDISELSELRGIRFEGGKLILGAGTRHRELIESPLVREHVPLLSMAAEQIAHKAIRSRGTLGGSLAHADPTAELPAVAVALDAQLVLVSSRGERRVAAADFFVTYLTTALEPDEIVRAVEVPAPAGRRYAFKEFARRPGDFAIVAVAGMRDGDTVTLAFAGVGGTPEIVRLSAADGSGALEAAVSAFDPDADIHASRDYRLTLARELGHDVVAALGEGDR